MTSSPLRREVDVAVIGGGPAGAAAATRLSRWGYSVALLTKPTSPEVTLGESLPPSIMKPLIGVRGIPFGGVEATGGRSHLPVVAKDIRWPDMFLIKRYLPRLQRRVQPC